ncbi:MAG: GlsB/YeaQ/YmgE family stress response membrane protein [Planctomycetaceae bacterium]|nr:GlsB/YeaQ/YmgE family stress response membrane protein [Planctomycetaceae bacterium]
MRFFLFVVIGLIAGWLAGRILKRRRLSWGATLMVGVIGAFLGGFIIQLLGIADKSLLTELITATLGSMILLYLLQFAK